MTRPSILPHLRDILILPFSVTVIIPYLIYDGKGDLMPNNIVFKTLGFLVALGGLLLFLYTVFLFKTRGNGTLAPWSPTQRLVVSGPYRYCRNPMISGVFFILLGQSFIFNSRSILIWVGIFFLINTLYFIFFEEPSLHARFGEEYLTYKKNVPRWLPRLTPWKPV
jgi:protein-S-isoprenylcysteine O-methyltransferase Ste14